MGTKGAGRKFYALCTLAVHSAPGGGGGRQVLGGLKGQLRAGDLGWGWGGGGGAQVLANHKLR